MMATRTREIGKNDRAALFFELTSQHHSLGRQRDHEFRSSLKPIVREMTLHERVQASNKTCDRGIEDKTNRFEATRCDWHNKGSDCKSGSPKLNGQFGIKIKRTGWETGK